MSTSDKADAMKLTKHQMAALLADISDLSAKARTGLLAGDSRQFNEAMNQLDQAMGIASHIVKMPEK